jgi:hypothetical protein
MPVVGDIPDMTSDTVSFISLKRIYQEKAKLDKNEVREILLDKVLTEIDQSNNLKKEFIISSLTGDVNYLDIICKNWPQISLYSFSNLQSEDKSPQLHENDYYEDHNQRNLIWYLLIQASEIFYKEFKRYPGQTVHDKVIL